MTRIRTQNLDGSPVTHSYDYLAKNGGSCTAVMSGDSVVKTFTEIPYWYNNYMEDIESPNYYKRSRNGEIMNSPMKKTTVIEETPVCQRTFGYTTQLWSMCYNALPYGYRWVDVSQRLWSGPAEWNICTYGSNVPKYIDLLEIQENDIDAMKSKAVTRAWSNIDHSEILALAAVAESGKTYSSLLGLLKKAHRIVRAVRKKNVRVLKRELRFSELVDLYMEARYSLRPLYYDITGLLSAVKAKELNGSKDRFTFRGKETLDDIETESLEFNNSYYAASTGCLYHNRLDRTSSVNVVVRAGVLTKLDLLTNANIYGLQNLGETAWELVPFSFIVDWFTNVGATIGSWTPNIGYEILASWVTTEIVQTQTSTVSSLGIENSSPVTGYRTDNPVWSMTGSHNKISRSYLREINPPRGILPRLNVNLSAWKILDLGIIANSLRQESGRLKKLRI